MFLREYDNFSVRVWYVLGCSVGRNTGLSFHAYHRIVFNAVEQKPTGYVLYVGDKLSKYGDSHELPVAEHRNTNRRQDFEMVKPDRKFHLVNSDSDLATFIRTQLGTPPPKSTLELICKALASQQQRAFWEALKGA